MILFLGYVVKFLTMEEQYGWDNYFVFCWRLQALKLQQFGFQVSNQ